MRTVPPDIDKRIGELNLFFRRTAVSLPSGAFG
jgi:hypothetical protein